MLEGDSMSKAARLVRIQNLLYRNERGLSTKELADACGVTQRTIQRDILALQQAQVPLKEARGGRYQILNGYFVPPVHLTLPEATALFLAARLLHHCSDEHNPHVALALAKLANVLPEPVGDDLQSSGVLATRRRPEDSAFQHVFEVVAECWATRRRVRIWHRGASRPEPHEYLLAPYFVEPSAPGFAIYVIGDVGAPLGLRTFKLERIVRAEPTGETFELPADFDAGVFLARAWGIMGGDAAVEIVLRFSPAVAGRVKESIWHRSQRLEDIPGGGVILRVWVSHSLEMVPWIRGWGPDVEVIGPADLRESIAADAARTAERYHGNPSPVPATPHQG